MQTVTSKSFKKQTQIYVLGYLKSIRITRYSPNEIPTAFAATIAWLSG
jgi:hypothetical protein